jgi:PBP1b-binding outer membrane lipoprotein LpoB
MKIILPLILMSFLMAGCSDESDEPAKYQFGSKDEYLKYYLPSR